MHMDLSDLNKVWEVKPLKTTGEKEARRMLDNVSNQVQPIMRKHKWKVQVLSEFSPSNPSLMGLNIGGGAEIKLRLRRPERQWDFFPYEQILDTMLHELCHNEHGPHDADFYKLLDELRLECEELMVKGARDTGRGSDIPGKRVSGVPQPLHGQNALAAAERRAHLGTLLPSGPRRIGGDSNIKTALSPTQAAAMAAERRLHDDLWCGSQSTGTRGQQSMNNASSSREPQDRGQQSSNNASSSWEPQDRGQQSNNDASFSQESQDLISSVQSLLPQKKMKNQGTWQCSMCTLANKSAALVCEACQTPRRKEVGQQSNNYATSSRETEYPISNVQSQPAQGRTESLLTWQCTMCTFANKPLALVCEACQTPRGKEVGQQSDNYASSSRETQYPITNVQSQPPRGKPESLLTWQCSMCTFVNKPLALDCETCQTPRRKEVGPQSNDYAPSSRETRYPVSNVQSHPPQEKPGSLKTWQCLMCTFNNKPLALVCEACQTPRSKEVGQQSNNYAPSSQETQYPISNVQSQPPQPSREKAESLKTWQCSTCTLINKPLALECEACETPRSKEVSQSFSGWSCKFCTLINDSKLERCSACEEWRYSYGPPASGYTPHVGT